MTNCSPQLEQDEVTEFLKLPTDQAHKAIDHIDVDGDGVVSLHELIR
jgi:Ca2+-binding EF-hand superfamily protein